MMQMLLSPPTSVSPAGAILGEAPLWHPEKKCLFWLDIKGQRLHCHNTVSGENTTYQTTGFVSTIALADQHDFICANQNGFAYLDLDQANTTLTPIVDPEADLPGNRFNDGAVDPYGRIWAGTMDNAEVERRGQWWRLDAAGNCELMDNGFMVTNGPVFDSDRQRIYLTDSADQTIFRASLSKENTVLEKTVFKQFGEGDGYPDGMVVDNEGCLWIAFWDGACVRRLSPDGDVLEKIDVPALRPTSVEIVADTLYITSASIDLTPEQVAAWPHSGSLFKAKLNKPLQRNNNARFGSGAIA